jgi:hypothetical protein
MHLETQTMNHAVGRGSSAAFSFPASGRFLLAPEASEVAGGIGQAEPAQGTSADSSGLGSSDLGGLGDDSRGGFEPAIMGREVSASGSSGLATSGGEGEPPPSSVTPPAGQGAESWQSIREAARTLGYDLSSYQDDQSALAHLVQSAARAKEANYYAQLGQQLAPHAQGIQEYLAQQKKPVVQERPAYAPPEFDKRWLSLVEFDQNTGMYLAKPGAPSEVAQKVNAFAEWQEKFRANPLEMIQPAIDDRLSRVVEERVSAVLANHQRQQSINQIVAQNADWMYQKGADGRPLSGADGRYVTTPHGTRYAQHVAQLQRSGVNDPVTIDALARNMLAGEIAMAQVQRSQQQQQAGVTAAPALAVARAQANPLQAAAMAAPGAFVPGSTEPTDGGLSLTDMLRRDMRAAGVTDADFANID